MCASRIGVAAAVRHRPRRYNAPRMSPAIDGSWAARESSGAQAPRAPVALSAPGARELERARELYAWPLLDLVFEAASVHRAHHDPRRVQCAELLSIKTGACPEDCSYCSQSSRYRTGLEREPLLALDQVVAAARDAQRRGADRFCMGAAWREVRDGPEFERVLAMVRAVKELGLETCCTLGMLDASQAARLKHAGLDYYNHNLDTGASHYAEIVSTRTQRERLETLARVRAAGIAVCCGGILGLGEPLEARIELLAQLAALDPQPESVPINALVRVPGTPLAGAEPLEWTEIVRAVAVARLLMPRAVVRLSAGRGELDEGAQGLCFLAGANSIFVGEELLTTPNPAPESDARLLAKLGLAPLSR
jgi:biotin synthase